MSLTGEAKCWLEPKIELALNQGLSQKQINEALAVVHAHHEEPESSLAPFDFKARLGAEPDDHLWKMAHVPGFENMS